MCQIKLGFLHLRLQKQIQLIVTLYYFYATNAVRCLDHRCPDWPTHGMFTAQWLDSRSIELSKVFQMTINKSSTALRARLSTLNSPNKFGLFFLVKVQLSVSTDDGITSLHWV